MFRVGPVIDDGEEERHDPGPVGERRPFDPFDGLDPSNPPHPRSAMGKAVLRRNNQLRKMYIGRMKANEGYHHDSSPSS
eukprot:3874629-Amphidinium_carterae.1